MEIKCTFNTGKWFRIGETYICKITSESITEPNQEIKDIIGIHKTGKTDRDVEVICFLNTEVHYMPIGISKIFPNLKAIQIKNCGLREVTREDLVGLENIESLYLDHDALTSLPDDLLEGMKKLKVICFDNNKLEFISSRLLEPVLENKLTYVGFLNNPTINAFFYRYQMKLSKPTLLAACYAGLNVNLPGLMKLIDGKCKKPTKDENRMKSPTSDESLGTFKDKFLRSFKDFWISGQFSDFTFIVGDKKIKVHKTVLAAQSEYFAEFFNDADDAIAELKSNDFSVEAVEAVLNWMYTGEIGDVKNAVEVFSIAMQLKISDLKPIAEELSLKSINEDNALEILKIGNQFNCEKIKKSAINEIKKFLADPDLDEELMNEPEKFEKLVQIKKKLAEVKKSYEKEMEEIKKNRCKKRKLDDI